MASGVRLYCAIPLAGQGPRRKERAVLPCVAPRSKAVVPVGYWRAPWGASLFSGGFDVLEEELPLSPPPATIYASGQRAQRERSQHELSARGSLAACGVGILVLFGRLRFQRRRCPRMRDRCRLERCRPYIVPLLSRTGYIGWPTTIKRPRNGSRRICLFPDLLLQRC